MTRRRLSIAIAAVTTSLVMAFGASSASADHHLMKIRQIHPANNPLGGEWVELQMFAADQNLVGGKAVIRTFDPGGNQFSIYPIPSNAGSGQNQRTILISSLFTPAGVAADFVAMPSQLDMTGQDGAVCFSENNPPTYTPIDCVAYGNFTGTLPTGTPAVQTPFESTLERDITANCATALDDADDTNNSAADFALSTREPRNNATVPTEQTCEKAGVGGNPSLKCQGKTATLRGTASKDKLKGTAKRDVIAAGGGNDTVSGLKGNDLICGEDGKDTLRGGAGKDLLAGGGGADLLAGGAKKDKLLGQAGKDVCKGGAAADTAKKCETEKTL